MKSFGRQYLEHLAVPHQAMNAALDGPTEVGSGLVRVRGLQTIKGQDTILKQL